MVYKWRLTIVASVLSIICFMCADATASHSFAFTNRYLLQGSKGYDVDELQSRLGKLGYYHGHINGTFDWQTHWAVVTFQRAFGLKPDGVVGIKTKTALVKATPTRSYRGGATTTTRAKPPAPHAVASPTSPADWSHPTSSHLIRNLSDKDINLVANAVYGEARGEPFIGQVAVAAVILNRLESPKFPHTIPGIIFQPGAFDAVNDGQIYLTPNAEAKKAVIDALHGMDPSDGALYYFNPAKSTSKWIWSRPEIKTIGHHIFAR